jgi:hypothetical protein
MLDDALRVNELPTMLLMSGVARVNVCATETLTVLHVGLHVRVSPGEPPGSVGQHVVVPAEVVLQMLTSPLVTIFGDDCTTRVRTFV